MTINYLMVTRAGKGLERTPGASGPTFAQGSGPTTVTAADQGFSNDFASGLSPWSGSSYNYDTEAQDFNPTLVSGRARINIPSGINGDSGLSRSTWAGWDDVTLTAEVAVTASANGQTVRLSANWFGAAASGSAQFSIESGRLLTKITGQASLDVGAYDSTNHRWWRIAEKDGKFTFSVSPNGTTWTALDTRTHGLPVPNGVDPALVSLTAQNSASAFAALEVFLDNVTLQVGSTPVGVDPATFAAYGALFKPKGYSVEPRDIIAPTGFSDAIYRVVRDPSIVTDDSGNTLGTQVYNHAWVLSSLLVTYLSEQSGYGGKPVPWPSDGGYRVVPVTGTPVVNDGAGTYGLQSVTWPGSSVGVGTLRQVVSGDEGSTRKVAAILDLLASTTTAQRDTIESTYTSTKAAVETARQNLNTVVSAASDATRRQFYARADLAWFLACQAVAAPRGPSLENALMWAMQAVVAKEAGLIGATFTTANYETMTQPIDAVLAMPSGY
ncbi:hypothetical protein [Nocardioides caricicola]|uniref:LamG domain-containing protein n=1 Tax=Nocardioides caricicola TaxID=634770 RepID=A0ABW0N2L9_9ACTN